MYFSANFFEVSQVHFLSVYIFCSNTFAIFRIFAGKMVGVLGHRVTWYQGLKSGSKHVQDNHINETNLLKNLNEIATIYVCV